MSEGLLRQRRNLILLASLLWLMKFGGVKFGKFALAGFDVEFARPEALIVCLWLAFFYFLYRYYQYFIPEGVPKLQAEFENTLNRYSQKSIDAYIRSQEPNWSGGTRATVSALWHTKRIFRAERLIKDPDGVARRTEKFELLIPRRRLAPHVVATVLNLLFRLNVTTDYLLPLLLACYVLWYCGSADWPGSFLSILFKNEA